VTRTCKVLGFSTQAFNKWLRALVSNRDWDDAYVINAAFDIHQNDPEYGYRFISDELKDAGVRTSERRVWRLCSQQQLCSRLSKKKGRSFKAGPPVHDDLVERQFRANQSNALWLTDITQHHTREGKLYLCAIKDVHSNRIVGYSMDERMTASLAVTALRNAIRMRNPEGTIVHWRWWFPISFHHVRAHSESSRPKRIHGTSRGMW
jgi:transposase InsO family protein